MVRITKQVSQTIPNATSPTSRGIFTSTINLGNRFAKRRIRDVNVTLQGTASSQGAPWGLTATRTSPSGANQFVLFGITGTAWGPLTIDDESPLLLGFGPPPCPALFLCEPFIGSAKSGSSAYGETPLSALDNGKVRGPWTLTIYNLGDTETNNLTLWGLTVATGRPYAVRK